MRLRLLHRARAGLLTSWDGDGAVGAAGTGRGAARRGGAWRAGPLGPAGSQPVSLRANSEK